MAGVSTFAGSIADVSGAGLMPHLHRLIAAQGPISVAQYMAETLGNPEHGYYTTGAPFGTKGDFVTAPEISQMFGELIGAWCADVWLQMGQPRPFSLVELGPGRGTLMSDALRATRGAEGFVDAVDLHLVEISPVLRRQQADALAAHRPTWHDALDSVPDGPVIVVANELFDALPVHQFQFVGGHWRERLIDVDEAGGRLRFVLGPAATEGSGSEAAKSDERPPPPNAIREDCPSGRALIERIGCRIKTQGGAAVVVDYGYDRPGYGDTLQAVRKHQPIDVLATPGEADLCAHVDFVALVDAARGTDVTVWGPVTQGRFLKTIGIEARADALKQAEPGQSGEIDAAVARLTETEQMGSLFKVLAMTSAGVTPAGFSA